MGSVDALLRVPLLDGPTPLARLEHFRRALGPLAPRIWIKRDDRGPLALGGNKLRKLELLLADAVRERADTVITLGAVQSNHCAQTAAAARRLGLLPVLLLRGAPEAPPIGNLALDRLFGAEIRLEPAPSAGWGERVATELRAAGRTPYLIPYGGSNALGALGFFFAGSELETQAEARGLQLKEIVVASSSGGTQAGLVLARAAGRLRAEVLGISVDLAPGELSAKIHALTREAATRFDLVAPGEGEVRIADQWIGPGYAELDDKTRDAIELLARTEGILTDPVYTGKAIAALIDLARAGRWSPDDDVLFWHTGGVAAVFAYAEALLHEA